MRWLVIAIVLAAPVARGQAPEVIEHRGELTYHYPFQLLPARGRYQPALSLDYSSVRLGNEGMGWGWKLSTSYIESDARVSRQSATGPREMLFLVNGGSRSALVAVAGTGELRPEIESGYFSVTADASGGYTGRDGNGNTYTYSCVTPICTRWYLVQVADPDDNLTKYDYLPIGQSASARLHSIRYNFYRASDPAYTGPIGDSGDWAAEIKLQYVPSASPSVRTEAGALTVFADKLLGVIVSNKRTLQLVTYTMSYGTSIDASVPVLRKIFRYGLNNAFGGETTFGYGAKVGMGEIGPSFQMGPGGNLPNWSTYFGAADARPAWMDVDADGRTDAVFKGKWARNITMPGDAAIRFEDSPRSASFATNVTYINPQGHPDGSTHLGWFRCPHCLLYQPGPGTERVVDFNSDGIPDLVTLNATGGNSCAYRLSLGAITSNGDYVADTPATCVASAAGPIALTWHYDSPLDSAVGLFPTDEADLLDVTGDGVPDLVYRVDYPQPFWQEYSGAQMGTPYDCTAYQCPPLPEWLTFSPETVQWLVYPGYRDGSGTYGFGPSYAVTVADPISFGGGGERLHLLPQPTVPTPDD